MDDPLKEIFEEQSKLNSRKKGQCEDAMRNSRFAERMTRLYANAKEFRRLPLYLRDEHSQFTNCIGVLGYVIGEEGTMTDIAVQMGLDREVKLSLLGRRPGYMPIKVMKRFLDERCEQVERRELQRDDVVVFKSNDNGFDHAGIYLCTVEAKPVPCHMMFHQYDYGAEIGFFDVLDYYEQESPDVLEYHRLKA
jgi:hypothetical protein